MTTMKYIGLPAIVGAAMLLATPPASAATCEELAALKLPDTTITMAQTVAAGAFTQPGGRGGGVDPDERSQPRHQQDSRLG